MLMFSVILVLSTCVVHSSQVDESSAQSFAQIVEQERVQAAETAEKATASIIAALTNCSITRDADVPTSRPAKPQQPTQTNTTAKPQQKVASKSSGAKSGDNKSKPNRKPNAKSGQGCKDAKVGTTLKGKGSKEGGKGKSGKCKSGKGKRSKVHNKDAGQTKPSKNKHLSDRSESSQPVVVVPPSISQLKVTAS